MVRWVLVLAGVWLGCGDVCCSRPPRDLQACPSASCTCPMAAECMPPCSAGGCVRCQEGKWIEEAWDCHCPGPDECAQVTIDFDGGACSTPQAASCGGDPTGSWCITAFCARPDDWFASVGARCPGATAHRFSGIAQGWVAFDRGIATVSRRVFLTGSVDVPPECRADAGCDDFAPLLAASTGGTSSCLLDARGWCLCNFSRAASDWTAFTFSADGGTLVTRGPWPDTTFGWCVAGDQMHYQAWEPLALDAGLSLGVGAALRRCQGTCTLP